MVKFYRNEEASIVVNCSNLERVLSNGNFSITAEIGPPKGSDYNKIVNKAKILRGYADAFNLTDNQTAVVRMSSIAGSLIVLKQGLEPIMQMCCRDRNRIALQSDILGASAIGIKNVLCITGDHQSFGNHSNAMGVFDLDSIQLIEMLDNMRNGFFQNREEIKFGVPNLFLGGVANPFGHPTDMRIIRLEKKIEAGADFIQTQSVFDLDKFNIWMDRVRECGLDKRVFILAGITPLKSLKMTNRMRFFVPGVQIPESIAKRIEKSDDAKKEGFEIALELINKIKKIKGVSGIHITALFWEDIIPIIIKQSGFYPRP